MHRGDRTQSCGERSVGRRKRFFLSIALTDLFSLFSSLPLNPQPTTTTAPRARPRHGPVRRQASGSRRNSNNSSNNNSSRSRNSFPRQRRPG